MRDERARRRPKFCSGIDLQLADGQVWSLPVPGEPIGEVEATGGDGGSKVTWEDRRYGSIIRAIVEAEDEGDLFRAELALAIHLLNWNYALDPDDFEDILDDHGEGRRRADLSNALNRLAMAHLRPFALPADCQPDRVSNPGQDDFRRVLGHQVSPILGRRVPPEGRLGRPDRLIHPSDR
jgi:hypothetical protein